MRRHAAKTTYHVGIAEAEVADEEGAMVDGEGVVRVVAARQRVGDVCI